MFSDVQSQGWSCSKADGRGDENAIHDFLHFNSSCSMVADGPWMSMKYECPGARGLQ
jgi:hypothetical protein